MNIFDNIAANLSLKYENSEFYKNKLIKRYKPLITPGVKSQDELIISLEKHFDLEQTDKAVMSKTFLELCVMGNIDCDEPDMIDFEIYRVVRNSKSEALYACEKYDLDDDDIFIIFEEHNNFFISNSQIVEMLLIIKEGVSAEDYENETPEFLNYIRVCRYFCQTNFFKLNKAVIYDEFDMIDIPEDESDSDDADYFDESENDADDDFTDAIEF